MIEKGVYAASLSVINEDHSLDIEKTISHAESLILNGLHGVFFFGSTGQSQLVSISEKKSHKSRSWNTEFIYCIFLRVGDVLALKV